MMNLILDHLPNQYQDLDPGLNQDQSRSRSLDQIQGQR